MMLKSLERSATVLVLVPLLAVNTGSCTRAAARRTRPVHVKVSPDRVWIRPVSPSDPGTFRTQPMHSPAGFSRPGDGSRVSADEIIPRLARGVGEADEPSFVDHARDASRRAIEGIGARFPEEKMRDPSPRSGVVGQEDDADAMRDDELRAYLCEGDRLRDQGSIAEAMARYQFGAIAATRRYGAGSGPARVFEGRLAMAMLMPAGHSIGPPVLPRGPVERE